MSSSTSITTATTATSGTSSPQQEATKKKPVAAWLTGPSVQVSMLMTAILVFCTHTLFNALLLSFHPRSCSFWNLPECSTDHGWILQWYAHAKFHTALLLGSFAASSLGHVWLESKVGYLTICIIMCYMTGGMAFSNVLNTTIMIFQTVIMVTLLVVILFWISVQEFQLQPGSAYLNKAFRSRSLSMGLRRKIAIPTVTLGIQLILAVIQVGDAAFRTKNGYLGDDSSDIFQSISSLAKMDMMMVPLIMLFALVFGEMEQHKALLKTQGIALFVMMLLLSSKTQTQFMPPEQVKVSMAATFSNMVMSAVGGGALVLWH